MQKLEENDRFCLNEVFRGAFGSKLGPGGVKKHAGFDSEVRFRPKPCFRDVFNDFFFSKKNFVLLRAKESPVIFKAFLYL